jgi:predicted dinucleotide-binding enzyme
MKIVIVGSGNAATILGKIIKRAGHEIVQVLSRNELHAKALADVLGSAYGNYITSPYKNADIYLFALTDNALHHLYEHV